MQLKSNHQAYSRIKEAPFGRSELLHNIGGAILVKIGQRVFKDCKGGLKKLKSLLNLGVANFVNRIFLSSHFRVNQIIALRTINSNILHLSPAKFLPKF